MARDSEFGNPDNIRAREHTVGFEYNRGDVYHGEKTPERNTDYEFPEDWGRKTDAQKCRWYEQDRSFRQAYLQWQDGGLMNGWSLEDLQGKEPVSAWNEATNPFRHD